MHLSHQGCMKDHNFSKHVSAWRYYRQIQLLLSADYNLDIIGCQLILEENLSRIDIFNTHETNILQ